MILTDEQRAALLAAGWVLWDSNEDQEVPECAFEDWRSPKRDTDCFVRVYDESMYEISPHEVFRYASEEDDTIAPGNLQAAVEFATITGLGASPSLLKEREIMLQKISAYEAGEPILQERIYELTEALRSMVTVYVSVYEQVFTGMPRGAVLKEPVVAKARALLGLGAPLEGPTVSGQPPEDDNWDDIIYDLKAIVENGERKGGYADRWWSREMAQWLLSKVGHLAKGVEPDGD